MSKIVTVVSVVVMLLSVIVIALTVTTAANYHPHSVQLNYNNLQKTLAHFRDANASS